MTESINFKANAEIFLFNFYAGIKNISLQDLIYFSEV